MQDNWKWSLVAAVAPVAWGSNYLVTQSLLPADSPLWGSALRALPAAILLLLLARRVPRGSWWWRALVLGVLNVGAFFVLVYVAAQLLPSSIAATIMACSPLVMVMGAWAILHERPAPRLVLGGVLGVAGVALLVSGGSGAVGWGGVAASVAAMVASSIGFVLTKKWARDVPPLTVTAWQIAAGAILLVIVALAVEGPMPAYDAGGVVGIAYTSLVATALAYLCWFSALRRLPAGTIGLIGLLNPLTGVLLGVVVGGEHLAWAQVVGVVVVMGGIGLGQASGRGRPPGNASGASA